MAGKSPYHRNDGSLKFIPSITECVQRNVAAWESMWSRH